MEERRRKLCVGGGKWRKKMEGDMEEKVEGCSNNLSVFIN